MSYKLTHDISCRLAKQLKLGLNHNGAALLEILKDLLRLCQGKSIESKDVINLVIKLTQMKDFRIKKLVYLYLSFVVDDESDMWLQVMNSVTNDLLEPSPIMKKSSLLLLTDSQSVSSVLNETRLSLIEKSLKDSNNAVRRCATAGVTKFSALIRNHHEQIDMSDTLEFVNKMIYADDDPSVIVQCIHCLHWSGKYDLENRLLLSLIERLAMVDVWTKAEIVNLFLQIFDRDKMSQDEMFQCLNMLDPYLDGEHPFYLSLICSCAMIFVTSEFSAIFEDVVNKVIDLMLSQLSLVAPYYRSAYFSMLEVLSRHSTKKIQQHFKAFTPLFSDDPFVKYVKLKLLGRSCTKENCTRIFKIVTGVMLTAQKWEVVEAAAESLFNLYDYLSKECVSFMVDMLSHDSCMIFETTVIALWQLVFYGKLDLKMDDDGVSSLIRGYPKMCSLNGKTAFFSLLNILAVECHVAAISAVMTTELTKWDDEESGVYKLLLLRYIHVLYFLSPSHFDAILNDFIAKGTRDSNPIVCRQAVAYHRLLKTDGGELKTYLDTVVKLRSMLHMDPAGAVDLRKIKSVSLLTVARKRFK